MEEVEIPSKLLIPHCREKLLVRDILPVPKPTQVGGKRILRCAGEPSLRNSAKCTRNFGIRVATVVKELASGA